MRFFSKITFICNLCFVAAAIFRLVEISNKVEGNNEVIIPLPPLQNLLVTLGFSAVVLNFIFALCCLIYWLLKKQHNIAKWLLWVNLLFLVLQLFYFKLY